MSDNGLFEWGSKGTPLDKTPMSPQTVEAEKQARIQARYAEMKAINDAKKDKWNSLLLRQEEPNDDTLDHVWITHYSGDIRVLGKQIAGKALGKHRYLRVRDDKLTMQRGYQPNHYFNPLLIPDIIIVRLTKSQAMMAKLSTTELQYVEVDPDGSLWRKLERAITNGQLSREPTWIADELKALHGLMAKVMPK